MKWFKHMTNSADDEKLALFLDLHGLEGYGFWWRVMEIIASHVGEKNATSVQYSAKRWCKLIGIRPQTLRKLLTNLTQIGLAKSIWDKNATCFNEVLISIDIPNILKYRDEYTERKAKKSGQAPDSIPSKNKIQNKIQNKNKEEEKNINTHKEEDLSSKEPAHELEEKKQMCVEKTFQENFEQEEYKPQKTDCPNKGHPQYQAFQSCFAIFPVKQAKEAAWREWMRLHENNTLEACHVIHDKIAELIASDARWEAGYCPNFANWLRDKRWNDEPIPKLESVNPYENEAVSNERMDEILKMAHGVQNG